MCKSLTPRTLLNTPTADGRHGRSWREEVVVFLPASGGSIALGSSKISIRTINSRATRPVQSHGSHRSRSVANLPFCPLDLIDRTTQTAMMYATAPMFGKIYDNYGPRPLLYFGTFMHVFGLMMASLAHEYYQIFLAQSICSALGAAALFYAGTNPVGTWFWKNRAFAFGIVSAGSALSGCLLPIIVTRLLPTIGFAWTMRTCAFIFLAVLSVPIATLRTRTPPNAKPWELRAFFRPLSEKPFLFNTLGVFFFFLGVFVPFNFLILEAEYFGMAAQDAMYQIAILNGSSIFGRVIPGWLGDKLGRFNIMIATTALSTIFILGLWIPARSPPPIYAFSVLFGFTSGTFVSMTPTLVQQISHVREIGMRMGTSFSIVSLAALTGNPIAGALIEADNGGYLYLQIFVGCTMAVGCGLLVCARNAQVGAHWAKV
jgi:MFS family permease